MTSQTADSNLVPSARKLGGASLIFGAILLLAGNILHPRESFGGSILPGSTEGLARLIVNNVNAYYASHLMLMLAFPLMFLGFLTLYKTLSRGDPFYAMPALLLFGLATPLFTLIMLIDGFIDPFLAQKYLAAVVEEKLLSAMLLEFSSLLAISLVAPAFFAFWAGGGLLGASLIKANSYNKGFAWIGVVLGLIGVLGYVSGIFGPYWVSRPIFVPYAVAFTLWLLVLGILLYRHPPA
ncbi:MAG: hypothetical protein HYZ12_03715 [Thaumarchaeota archaeon]|nr:hypothetical protein [Nitrososphaerota archaeon]